jgi:hypothetical protein
MSSILEDIRQPLAAALEGVAASVYDYVPEAIIPPAAVIVYDSPAMESTLINGAVTKVKLNFLISAVVGNTNNSGALDNLEKLVIEILGAMPSGYVVGDVQRPQITQVGAANLLTADISVSTYYTQEN